MITQNFLHGEAIDQDREAVYDLEAAQSRYEANAQVDRANAPTMLCAGGCGASIPRSAWKVRCFACWKRHAQMRDFQGLRGRADFLTAGHIPGFNPRRRVFNGRFENRGNMHPRP